MKKITSSSGLTSVFAAVLVAVLVSVSFAEDPGRSELLELKTKIKNIENKIEQYKNCVSQERPGEIILYQDPSTSDCMAITTASFTDYLKENGHTTSEIGERLAIWDEKSSQVKKGFEESIVLMGSELHELRDKLTQLEKADASLETEGMPAAVRFDYVVGHAEADGRGAELHLAIDGARVKGGMTAKPVCKTGIRLPKTQITFSGKIDGPWEQQGSVITADWKGGDYSCDGALMKEYPQEGALTIQMRSQETPSGPEYFVFLKRTVSSSYGFVFKPLGKISKPRKSDISGDWLDTIHPFVLNSSHKYRNEPPGNSIPVAKERKDDVSYGGNFTFTRLDDNKYKAQYAGKWDGIALTQGNKVIIDIDINISDATFKMNWDLVLSADGAKAVGTWASSDGESGKAVLVKSKPEELIYRGIAAGDSRPATVKFQIAGNGMTGTAEIGSICLQNIHLGGASISFTGKLSGKWESKTGSIDGTWQGTDHMCGKDMPNNGSFRLFYKDDGKPVIHFRLKGQRGQYGYNLTPHNKVYASGNATPLVTEPDKPEKPPEDEKSPEPEEPLTPDDLEQEKVEGILPFPRELSAASGGQIERPGIYVVIKDTAEQRKMDPDSLEWKPDKGVDLKDENIVVSDKMKVGDILFITATAKIGIKTFSTKVKIRVVEDAKTGTYSGSVYFEYGAVMKNRTDIPRRPVWARVELRHRLGAGGVYDKTETGPSGEFVFKNVPRGYYKAWAVEIAPTQLPNGYKLKNPMGPWPGYRGDMPDDMELADKAGKPVENWDVTHKGVPIEVVQPKTASSMAGKVYGRVTHKGQGVEGVKVMADIDGGGEHYEFRSNSDGEYVLDFEHASPGSYRIQAEKYITPGWARCGDLLDVAKSKRQEPVKVLVPVNAFNGKEMNIEVETRKEIFGACSDEEPPSLPGRSR